MKKIRKRSIVENWTSWIKSFWQSKFKFENINWWNSISNKFNKKNAEDLLELFHACDAINFEMGYQSFAAFNSSSKKYRINIFIVIDNALHDLNIDNMYTSTIICTNESLGEKIATPCLPKLVHVWFWKG